MFKLMSDSDHLYMQVYHYFQKQITDGSLTPGSKMPSLRRCAQELELSRTTVEAAYLQLAADGYLIAKPQSGYYVTDLDNHLSVTESVKSAQLEPIRFDFASSGVDRTSFRFQLWQRYLKSALRQDQRLLTYGEPQGEEDFRQVLADYVKKQRNILCKPEDIVVGAGVQSLLHILCPLLRTKKTVSFPTSSFLQGISVFQDYGFEIFYRNKDCDLIYVTPAHMTKWGEIMPVSRRLELVHHTAKGHLVLEDDFENEFVYLQKPTPSLYTLDGGKHVVYIGSFSRLLLPSIRISFMILPRDLSAAYQKVASHYNQTASKAEQIALTQFIRDGHLAAQIRRLRRLYTQKMKKLLDAIEEVFQHQVSLKIGSAGTSVALTLSTEKKALKSPLSDFPKFARSKSIGIEALSWDDSSITLLLSCSAMPLEDFPQACLALKAAWEEFSNTVK